jgi:hypothetical protein
MGTFQPCGLFQLQCCGIDADTHDGGCCEGLDPHRS